MNWIQATLRALPGLVVAELCFIVLNHGALYPVAPLPIQTLWAYPLSVLFGLAFVAAVAGFITGLNE